MSEKKYRPKAGLTHKDDEVIVSTSSKEIAAQYVSTHEASTVFQEMKPQTTDAAVIKIPVVSVEEKKPDLSAIKPTVSESSWQDFKKIDLGDAPPPPVYISEAEFAATQEVKPKPEAPLPQIDLDLGKKEEKQSDIAMLNEFMPDAKVQSLSSGMEEAEDADSLQRAINSAVMRRDEIASEIEALNVELSHTKEEFTKAEKEYHSAPKAVTLEGLEKEMNKKQEDYQSAQGEHFSMEQSGNEAKIAKAKEKMEKAKAEFEAAKTAFNDFDPSADTSSAANTKYLSLQQNVKNLEGQITAKKKDQKSLADAISTQENRLRSLK